MPDLSNYSPDKPFVPHIFGEVNLSDAFVPSVGLPTVSSPSGLQSEGGDDPWQFFLSKTGRNPFKGLGIVPAGPAASDDYWENRKFSSESDSYQTGNTYKDIGYLIGRDNESIWAKNRGWWDESFNTVTRWLDKSGAYAVQGMGFLGGLMGIGNKNENYTGSGFANWIAGASDNALSTWARGVADEVDNVYRPIYQEAEDKEKGFFRRALTDSEFWKGEAVDGLAFLTSAYVTGGNIGKVLDIGGKAVRGIAAARGLNYASKAAALSDEGLSGVSAATNLSRAGATAVESAPVVANVASPTAGKIYSRFLNEAGNFANARKINMGVSTLINTGSEAMFEATELKHTVTEQLQKEMNLDGTPKYTPQQIKDISANAAKNSFLMNMLVLPLSNLWETKMFYGKVNPLSARNAANPLIKRQAGLLSNAELVKRTFGQKGLDYFKNMGEGILKEGFWEENIQLAIERINKAPENVEEGFFSNLGRVINQYARQTANAIGGNDTEASTSIGLGGLIGGGMSAVNRSNEIKSTKRDIVNYNNAINSFRTTAKDLYEKNPDGSIRLNEGEPVINPANVLSYISSMNKTLNMTELADNMKVKNMKNLHSIVDSENIARLVKAYADNGMADALLTKLDDSKGFKSEDLMLLGLNPDKLEGSKRIDEIKEKVTEYKNIYDNIEKNFFVKLRNDDQNGSKARLMKDKLYYLSARASNLGKLKVEADAKVAGISNEIARIHPAESANDSLADKLNELHGRYKSAKKRADYLSTEQRRITDGQRMLEDSADETIEVGNGVTLTQKKKTKKTPSEQFTGVDEEELNQAVSNMTTAEKELKEFLLTNKDEVLKMKKNADGTFRYENAEKNQLAADSQLTKERDIALDVEQARNATLNVFSRLSDIKYGERYFDNVYAKRKQDLYNSVVADEREDMDENLEDPDPNQPKLPGSPSQNLLEDRPISEEEFEEVKEELNRMKREKESMEGSEDVTLEDEVKIDKLNQKIKETEAKIKEQEVAHVEWTIAGSTNIPQRFKEDYKRILEEIAENTRNTTKHDTYYEINGQRYAKVSDVIGNVVPEELRPSLQGALVAGYTVDAIVKAYFTTGITDAVRQEVATKISEQALAKIEKQLEAIRNKLRADGVNIVATNVVVFDPALKVAGEIDILGVDKNGNFKIYEIEARQGRIWAQIATKQGRGPAIYQMSQKQLSAYRNLFSNLYGATPNTISVMFPIDVTYDKDANTGFIEKVNLKPEIRYTPTNNVSIKSNVFQPIKVGSKYDAIDLTGLFINSFIPKAMDVARDKLRFLLRNQTFDQIKKGITIGVKDSEQKFLEAYNKQQQLLSSPVPGGPVNILSTPSDSIIKTLSGLKSFNEKLNYLRDNNLLQPIVIGGKSYNAIDYSDRVMVLMKIGNVNMPFYISTGQAGKKDVKAGDWYAVFGIGDKGWINKGTAAEINTQYGSPILQKIAKILNEGVGTTKGRDDTGKVKEGIGFLDDEVISLRAFNKQMNLPITPAATNSDVNTFLKNIKTVGDSINAELSKMSAANTTAVASAVDGYTLSKIPDVPNLYALKGNKEISINYEGQFLGFMPPSPALAYKAADGTFKILDENTDIQTYKDVTGNSEQTYSEFVNISRAYKKAYGELTEDVPGTFSNKQVQEMFDIQMSYGELDLVSLGGDRFALKDLVINGVKVGNTSVITVVHTDDKGLVQVMMDKKLSSKSVSSKYYEMDKWANNNTELISKASSNKRGEKVTEYVALVETPNGDIHPIALRLNKDAKVILSDYDGNLGTKFTSSTTKNVFKNESVALIPKKTAAEAVITLKGDKIVASVYPTENVTELEKFGTNITGALETQPVQVVVNTFLKSADPATLKNINAMFAAFPMTVDELTTEIVDDFNSGNWPSITDYIDNLKCNM